MRIMWDYNDNHRPWRKTFWLILNKSSICMNSFLWLFAFKYYFHNFFCVFFSTFFHTHLRGNAKKVRFFESWNFFDKNLRNGPFFGLFQCSFVGKKTTAWSLISDPHFSEPHFWAFSQVRMRKNGSSKFPDQRVPPLVPFFMCHFLMIFPSVCAKKRDFEKSHIFEIRIFRYPGF